MARAATQEEREYEAQAVRRQEEWRRKEKEMKQEAVAKAISGAGGQVIGILYF